MSNSARRYSAGRAREGSLHSLFFVLRIVFVFLFCFGGCFSRVLVRFFFFFFFFTFLSLLTNMSCSVVACF